MTRKARGRGGPAPRAAAPVPAPAPGQGSECPQTYRRWLLLVFVVSFVAGLVHVLEIRLAPWSDMVMGDAAAYDAWARRIAAGDWVGREVFYQAPLYPYFLAVVYRLAGTELLVVRLLQVLIGAGSAVLLADAARRLFDWRAGVAAGLLLAVYPPAVFSTALLQKSVLDLAFVCAATWLLAEPLRQLAPGTGITSVSRGRWALLGVVLGCLTLTRENAAVLGATVIGWVLLDRAFAGVRLKTAALVMAGAAVVLAPVAVRNAAVGGEAFLTTSQFGPNFYIGNNPTADGTYRSLLPRRGNARYEREDAVAMAEAAVGRTLSPAEVSNWFTDRALDFILGEPGSWLRLMGRKTALLWNRVEIVDTDDQYTAGEWSAVVGVTGTVLHMGVLAPLALFGIVVTRRRLRELYVLHAMLGAYAASVALFFVFARYRLPLVPLLILFAAAGLLGGRAWMARASRPDRAWAAALLLVALVFCNWPLVSPDAMRATMHYNIGAGYLEEGRLDAAAGEFRAALALHPRMAEAMNNLGIVYGRQGRYADAREAFEGSLAVDPDFPEALVSLGEALVALHRPADARRRFERAIDLAPDYARAYDGLGEACLAAGDAAGAERAYLRAAELAPDSATPLIALAGIAGRQGRLEAAEAYARRALAISPAREEIHNSLGVIAVQAGRLAEAAGHFERAAGLAPGLPQVHSNLAGVYAQLGRLEDARREFIAALQLRPGHEAARRGLREVERRLGIDPEDP